MTEFNALINDNFKKLPYEEQARIAGNFFDKELSNENFIALPAEEQTRIKSNFLSSTFKDAGIEPALPPEQGPGLLDKGIAAADRVAAWLPGGQKFDENIAAPAGQYIMPGGDKQYVTPMETVVGLGQLATNAVQAMPMNLEQANPDSVIANFISDHIPALGGKEQGSAMPEVQTISQGTPKPTDMELFKQVYKDKVDFAKKAFDVAKGFAEPFVGIFETYKNKGAEAGTQHLVQQMALDPLPVVWAAQIAKSLFLAGKIAPEAAKVADEVMAKASVDDMLAAKKASAELDTGDLEKQFEAVFNKSTKVPSEAPVKAPNQRIDVSSKASQELPIAEAPAKPISPTEAPKAPEPISEPTLSPKVAPEAAQAAEPAIVEPSTAAISANEAVSKIHKGHSINYRGIQDSGDGTQFHQFDVHGPDGKPFSEVYSQSLNPDEITKAATAEIEKFKNAAIIAGNKETLNAADKATVEGLRTRIAEDLSKATGRKIRPQDLDPDDVEILSRQIKAPKVATTPAKNAIAAKRTATKESAAQYVPKPATEPKPALPDSPAAKNFIERKRAEAAKKAEPAPKPAPPPLRKSEVAPSAPSGISKAVKQKRAAVADEFSSDRKALLAQIDEKMPKASTADGYETVDWKAYNRLTQAQKPEYEVPDNVGKFGTVTFETPSGVKYEIANHKQALEAFKKRLKKGPEETKPLPGYESGKASSKRLISDNPNTDVQYYNPYTPKKKGIVEGVGKGKEKPTNVFAAGFYTNGEYAIKTKIQPTLKKGEYQKNWQVAEMEGMVKGFSENANSPATISGQFVGEGTKEGQVMVHVVGKNGKEAILDSKYVDSVLSEHPKAKAFVSDEIDKPVIFRDGDTPGDTVVGLVMPTKGLNGATFFGENIKPRANEVLAGKGLPPTQLMAGGVAGIEQDENGDIKFNPMKAALGMGAMGIAGKVQARRAAMAEKVGGNTIARDFVNLVKGESGVPKPLQQAFRAGEGAARDAIQGSADLGKQMHVNFFKAKDSPALVKMADAAHRGDKAALDRIARFNKPLAEQIAHSRAEIDATTDALIDEIKKLYPDGKMPVKWEGNTIPAGKLIEVMKKNKGTYVRREYSINHVDGYKPSEQQWTDAVKGYMKDHPKHTEEQARIFLKRELELYGTGNAKPNMAARINKSPFMARENTPVWLRNFMGEIKDPALNHYLTTKALTNNVAKMRIFDEIAKDKSIFFDKATKDAVATVGDYVQVSARDDALAWGAIADKYTTPEMAEFLGDISKLDGAYDATFKNGIAALKKLKTSQNLPTHIRNFLGNIDFAMIGGISPLNPKNHRFYQQGRAALLGKNEALRHELVREGVIGTELAHAELINTSHDMINLMNEGENWTDRLKKGARAFDSGLTKAYSIEDQYFKAAKYLEARSRGLSKRDAVSEVYKYFPNYAEVSRFAKGVRESGVGSVLMPFFSFKSEAHRIFMNILKEGSPAEKAKLAAVLGWRSTYNLAALTAKGIPIGVSLRYLWKNNQINGSLADPRRPNRRGMTQRGIMPFDNYLPDERTFQGNIISGPIANVMRAKSAGNKIKGFARGINSTVGAVVSAAVDKDPSKLWDAIIPFRKEKYK